MIETHADQGASVSGQSVVTLADMQHLWLDVEVFRVSPFRLRWVNRWGLNWMVWRIQPSCSIDFPAVLQVRLRPHLPRPSERHAFQLEQTVGTVIVQALPDLLRVPVSAVISTGQRHIVAVDIGADRRAQRHHGWCAEL